MIADDLLKILSSEITYTPDDTGLLNDIFYAFAEMHMKPIEVSKYLEIDIAVVRNAIKRIRRICHNVLQKYQTNV